MSATSSRILEETLGTPVDIEFAHDGTDFYLLQCRPQSFADEDAPSPIPKDVAVEDTLFAAHRFVSNGHVPDITHVVYVDPEGYAQLKDRADLLAVGEAVGKLNKLLPKRQFILIGPGRWGSRGDIKLGVGVTYSDINNTAMLIEVARKTGDYLPDLSFGTHFFQDLVESEIRYLPLYPDDDGFLNMRLLHASHNLLTAMLPEYEHLSHAVRVIDVPSSSDGRILRVLMNSELDEAIALIAEAGERDDEARSDRIGQPRQHSESYWRWRMQMSEKIASEIDPERFAVTAVYIIGSTKNANAGPSSDIDLLIHFHGDESQRAISRPGSRVGACVWERSTTSARVTSIPISSTSTSSPTRTSRSAPALRPRSMPSPTPRSNSPLANDQNRFARGSLKSPPKRN